MPAPQQAASGTYCDQTDIPIFLEWYSGGGMAEGRRCLAAWSRTGLGAPGVPQDEDGKETGKKHERKQVQFRSLNI